MSQTTAIETHAPFVPEDKADDVNGGRTPYDKAEASDPEVVVYRISGAFFFGAAASIGSVLDRIADTHKALIIDFAAVPFVDSTAANTIEGLVHKTKRHGVKVYLSGTSPDVRHELFVHGLKPPHVHYENSITSAMSKAHAAE